MLFILARYSSTNPCWIIDGMEIFLRIILLIIVWSYSFKNVLDIALMLQPPFSKDVAFIRKKKIGDDSASNRVILRVTFSTSNSATSIAII